MLISMYDDVMHLWLCLFIIGTLSCHMITLFCLGTPTFCKTIQLSSHMLLSVNVVIFNPCVPLGGDPCTNLEHKTLLILIVEKTLSAVINQQKGGD
jgi:hypothetical protein